MGVDFHHLHETRRERARGRGLRSPARGFSLVELFVTLGVLSILTAVSIPLITSTINASRITGSANEFVAALQLARMESIRRNVRVLVCESSDGLSCTGGAQWRGWVVFADRNQNGLVDVDEQINSGRVEAPLLARSSGNIGNRILFRSDGLAYLNNQLLNGNMRLCMATTQPTENARDVRIAAGSRMSVGPATNVGVACAAPPN